LGHVNFDPKYFQLLALFSDIVILARVPLHQLSSITLHIHAYINLSCLFGENCYIEGDMDQSDNTRVFVIPNEIFFTHKWHFRKPFRYDTW